MPREPSFSHDLFRLVINKHDTNEIDRMIPRFRHLLSLLCAFGIGALSAAGFAQETQLPIQIISPGQPAIRQIVSEDAVIAQHARSAEARGEYERAVQIWTELLNRQPWEPQAIQSVPRLLMTLKKYDEAEAFLRGLLQKSEFRGQQPVHPGDPTSAFSLRIALGQVALAREDSKGAWAIWNAALQADGESADALRTLVGLLQQNRRWEDCDRLIRDYRKTHKAPSFLALEMAMSLRSQMNFAAAAEELLLYTASSPGGWQVALSYLHQFPDDPAVGAKVMPVLERALSRDKKNAALWQMVAGYALKTGDWERSLNATLAADSLSNGGGNLALRAAQQMLKEGEVALARRGFQKVIAWNSAPDVQASAELGLGECLEALRQWADAKLAYERFVELHPNFKQVGEARFRVANILLNYDNRPGEALTVFRGLWAQPHTVSRAQVGLKIGDCHAWMEEYAPAINAWSDVVRIGGLHSGDDATQALLRIARANLWRDSTDRALDALDSITAGHPANTAFNDAVLYAALLEEGGVYRAVRAFAEADFAEFRNADSLAAVRFDEAANLLKFGKLAEWARFSQAMALRNSRQPQAALAVLDTFIIAYRASVDLDRAKFLRALILADDLHNNARALDELQQFLIDHPRSLYLEPARRKARSLAARVS